MKRSAISRHVHIHLLLGVRPTTPCRIMLDIIRRVKTLSVGKQARMFIRLGKHVLICLWRDRFVRFYRTKASVRQYGASAEIPRSLAKPVYQRMSFSSSRPEDKKGRKVLRVRGRKSPHVITLKPERCFGLFPGQCARCSRRTSCLRSQVGVKEIQGMYRLRNKPSIRTQRLHVCTVGYEAI